MHVFRLKGYAETASFRVPESHTFHQTLPLPPRTTVVGLLGAALGLEFMKAMAWVDRNEIWIGIHGKADGYMRDFWSFDKIKVVKGATVKGKDVLTREFHAGLVVTLTLASPHESELYSLRKALQRPVFALTLGNSDDLLKVLGMTDVSDISEGPVCLFEDVWLPGDLLEACESAINLEALSPMEPVVAPRVFLLPDAFEPEGVKRNVARRRYYTHVGSRVRLANPIPAVLVEDVAVPLLRWEDD